MEDGFPFDVVSVNISERKGTAKKPVARAEADLFGLVGDAHRNLPNKSASILDLESILAFAAETGIEVAAGAFGENITTRGLDLDRVSPGDRLEIGDVLLEVMVIGKTCHGETCDIFRRVGRCIMPARGVFCRILRGGTILPGSSGSLHSAGADGF